ncbi:MAG: F0F1 ATP synthase subunit delta [Candidatus Sungiibacteriota bacterium]
MRSTSGQYAHALIDALVEASDDARPQIIRRFLALLRKNKDMRRLGAIMRKVEKQSLADQGLYKIAVSSVSPLTEKTKNEIEKSLAKKLLWEETIDPALLGGIRILIDDELLIDASARHRLDRMFNFTAS